MLMVMLHSPTARSRWERKDEYGWIDEHKSSKWFLELLLFSWTGSDGRQSSSAPRFESSSALYVIFPALSAALGTLKAMGVFLPTSLWEALGSCLPGCCTFVRLAARAALADERLQAWKGTMRIGGLHLYRYSLGLAQKNHFLLCSAGGFPGRCLQGLEQPIEKLFPFSVSKWFKTHFSLPASH